MDVSLQLKSTSWHEACVEGIFLHVLYSPRDAYLALHACTPLHPHVQHHHTSPTMLASCQKRVADGEGHGGLYTGEAIATHDSRPLGRYHEKGKPDVTGRNFHEINPRPKKTSHGASQI